MAGSTGLEPAASAVTGQRSNQLNYDPALCAERALAHSPSRILLVNRLLGTNGGQ
jgi:hypothetical protein